MTQHKQSHRIKWHDQHIKWHDMTCHVATNHSSSPHVTSQPSTLLHLTPQATSWHQNRSHHHHGTAEGSFTANHWFGHRASRSPCAHSIGNFFLWLIVFFFETSAPGLSGHYWCSPRYILSKWREHDVNINFRGISRVMQISWNSISFSHWFCAVLNNWVLSVSSTLYIV